MKRTFLFWLVTLLAYNGNAYDFESGGVYYDITSPSEVAVAAGDHPYDGYFALPNEVVYAGTTYQVTSIGRDAFRECYSLVSVELPQGLKTIGDSAFFCCTMLATMQFPQGLETIGDAAFYGCSGMYYVSIPASVKSIGSEAFQRCSRLTAFQIEEDNAFYSTSNGVLMDKQQTRLIAYPNGLGAQYAVPASVQEIGSMAFLGCTGLEEVSLPEGLKTIGEGAFYGCSKLQSVSVPQSVEHIGAWAFTECQRLKTATLGAGLSQFGEGVFSFCPELQYIRVHSSNNNYCSIDDVLFTKDQQTLIAYPGARKGAYHIPLSVHTIGETAFYGCEGLESVTLPATLSAIGDNPFVFCDQLKEIVVSSDHPDFTANDGVLLNKDQTAILFYPNGKSGAYTIPHSVTSLTSGPFMGSRQLTSLTIPANVTSIGRWTFMGCDHLVSVSLPSTLKTLGESAFLDCSSLHTIICSAQPQPTSAFASENFVSTTLYVPRGSEDLFRQAEGWSAFENISTFGIYADDQSVKRGRWYRLPVCTSGPLHLTSLQMDITLPDALEMATREDGSCLLELAEGVTGSLSCVKIADGHYRVTMSTDDKRGLKTDADTLMYMGLRGSAEGDIGAIDLLMRDISITFTSDVHDGEAQQPDQAMGLNLQLFLGDVNRNGQLNVADLVETYRYLFEKPTEDFHFSEADVNQNGKVNIADVMRTIDLLHEDAPATAHEWFWDGSLSADCLVPTDIRITQGGKAQLNIELRNTLSNYTAHQFHLLLPPGIEIASDDERYLYETSMRYSDSGQAVYIAEVGRDDKEGTFYNVICASPAVSPISHHEGNLLSLTLKANADQPLGELSGQLRRIVFADTEATEYAFDDALFSIKVEEDTGIAELEMREKTGHEKYYNLNGMRVTTPSKGIYIVDGRKVLMR